MRVLVIEDDNKIRQMLVDQLAGGGAETIYEAGNLTDALAVMRNADGVL